MNMQNALTDADKKNNEESFDAKVFLSQCRPSIVTEASSQGLSKDELLNVLDILKREPNAVELSIFAVMWSEHCSYKSSKVHLKHLPTTGDCVVQGPGENAGVVDLGDGDYLAFKIESHNHPSYIEPFQGAATGVGGILRDIFAMGARPIAVANSLHFGSVEHTKTPSLLKGVVAGISHYGNCMGIPNIVGETHFNACYNGNILVNAMAMGHLRKEHTQKGIAKGEGRLVVYLGAPTGCDGVHGATMASEEFDDDSEEKRPTVQVGDPFYQKILMEACLEMVEQKVLFGIQDMGAAGITCSTFEMSAKGESGMIIDLNKIPQRQKNLKAYELFLSESQERMLLVIDKEQLAKVEAIAQKWAVDCAVVGTVQDKPNVTAYFNGEVVVDLPVMPITEKAPSYNRPYDSAQNFEKTLLINNVLQNKSLSDSLQDLCKLKSEANKKSIYSQYDSTVRSNTASGPGSEAGVVCINKDGKKIAVSVDSRAILCASNAKLGIQHVISESVLNLSCVGAKALAITNCLNFGNPEEKNIMGQFADTIEGMKEASLFFDTPVTGGNVSFYNQTKDVNIYPTPSIGMIGTFSKSTHIPKNYFDDQSDKVFLIGRDNFFDQLYASVFSHNVLNEKNLQCPPLHLKKIADLQSFALDSIKQNVLSSIKDVSEGGLWQCLLESCVKENRGFDMALASEHRFDSDIKLMDLFLNEIPCLLVSCEDKNTQNIEKIAQEYNLNCIELGSTNENKKIKIDKHVFELCDMKKSYNCNYF